MNPLKSIRRRRSVEMPLEGDENAPVRSLGSQHIAGTRMPTSRVSHVKTTPAVRLSSPRRAALQRHSAPMPGRTSLWLLVFFVVLLCVLPTLFRKRGAIVLTEKATTPRVRDPQSVVFDYHHHVRHHGHYHSYNSSKTGMNNLAPLDDDARADAKEADFGDITVRLFLDSGRSRVIYKDPRANRGKSANRLDGSSDREWFAYLFAYDDDIVRDPYDQFDGGEHYEEWDRAEHKCRRVNWHREHRVACNSVHEVDLIEHTTQGDTNFLGSGDFREAFLVGDPESKSSGESFVFKQQKIDLDYGDEAYEYMRIDSLVMNLFQTNPLFLDIYNFCGLSQLVEFMPNGELSAVALPIQTERSEEVDVEDRQPQNSLTQEQKLTFSLEMAESIAHLHNYPRGVIVHDDIHLGQFLLSDDSQHLKFQDFNRAEIVLWDVKQHEYCTYVNGHGYGDWRAPEEYDMLPLDEKIDMYSLGNNMYSVLTGLWPFYERTDEHDVQDLVKNGETPLIHERFRNGTLIERQIVKAIDECWTYEPDERIDAHGVIAILRQAIEKP